MKQIEIELREKFITDFNLPIVLSQSPYFENSLDLLEKYYGTRTKWEKLQEEIGDRSPGKYLSDFWEKRKEIYGYLYGSEAYKKFQSDPDLFLHFSEAIKPKKKDIYNGENKGKRYISVDLKTANFQALRFYDPSIVRDCGTYQEFVRKFTDSWSMAEGKQTRQSIFGKLEPERQSKIEIYLVSALHELMSQKYVLNLVSLRTDELIYEVEKDKNYDRVISDLLWKSKNELGILVKVEIFTLETIQLFTTLGNSIFGFYKKYEDGKVPSFHGIPKQYIPQFIKYYEGRPQEINDIDLSFLYKDQEIVKFIHPLTNEDPSRF